MLLAGPNVSFLLLQQLLLLNILCHELVVAARPNRPHIWTVMVDDLGWNGMSFSGNNDEVQTPVVAQLARSEGVIFESHYVYKFCSPTRASFLTGRFPGHGIQETNLGMTSEVGCNGNLTMIAAKLKQAGYVTLQIGKWHQVTAYSMRYQQFAPRTADVCGFHRFIFPTVFCCCCNTYHEGLLLCRIYPTRSRFRHKFWLPWRWRGSPQPMPWV